MQLMLASSERLSVIRFPLIVGVVLIHAYGAGVTLKDGSTGLTDIGSYSYFLQELLSHGIARISVPLFFLMSGYLFFFGFQFSLDAYRKKLKSRAKTLALPFLFWNLLTMAMLFIAQSIPATSAFFSGDNQAIASYGIYDFFNAMLGIEQSPVSYQFWFIRDLILMIALVPLISLLLSRIFIARIVLCIFASLWFFDFWGIYTPSIAAVFFFYAGAFISTSKRDLFELDRFAKVILPTYLCILLVDVFTKDLSISAYIHNIGIVFGITSALCLSKLAVGNKRIKRALVSLSSYSFFVYAAHEPMLAVLKKITYKVLSPSTDLAISFIYLTVPAIIITALVLIGFLLGKTMPRFFGAITGGR